MLEASMASAVIAFVEEAAAYIAENVGNFLIAVGVPAGAATAVANVTFYAVEVAAYVGLALLASPSMPKSQAGQTPTKQTLQPRIRVGGRARVAGGYMLRESAENYFAVSACAMGPISRWERYYLVDDEVTLKVTGQVNMLPGAAYSQKAWLFHRRGLPTETSYTADKSFTELGPDTWGNAHRGDGIASLFLYCQPCEQRDFATEFPKGIPVASAVAVALHYDWRDATQHLNDWTTWKETQNPIVILADFETGTVNWNDPASIAAKVARFAAKVSPWLSDWTQAANDCDDPIRVKYASAISTAQVNAGATTIPLDNVTGIVSGTVLTLGSPNETVTVTGPPVGLNVPVTAVTVQHAVGAPASWAVASTVTVTEPRYRMNGWWYDSTHAAEVRAEILKSCDGFMVEVSDGSLRVQAGKYRPPDVTLVGGIGGDIISFKWNRGIIDEEATNVIAFSYLEPLLKFTTVPGDPWRDDDDIAARGKEKPQSPVFEWVPSHSQAQRLSKRLLSRLLVDGDGTIITGLSGLQVFNDDSNSSPRYMRVQIPDELAILADVVLEIRDYRENLAAGQLEFDVLVADVDIDAWNYVTEEGVPPLVTSTLIGTAPPTPVIDHIDPYFDPTGPGGDGLRIAVYVVDPGRADFSYAMRWRITGEIAWVENNYNGLAPAGGFIRLDSGFVPADKTLDVEAAFINGRGALSPWTTTASAHTVSTGAAVPPVSGSTKISAKNQIVRKSDFEDGLLGTWSAGTVTSGVGGSGFTHALQLAGGQHAQEGAIDRPVIGGGKYLVQVWARWIGSGSSNNKVGLITSDSTGGSLDTTATVNLFTLGGGLGPAWKVFSAQVQVPAGHSLAAPYIENTASGAEEFAQISITPVAGTLDIGNNVVTSSGTVIIAGNIPSAGLAHPGGTVTGSGVTASGTTGSGWQYDGVHYSNFFKIAEQTFTVPDIDGTGFGGAADVFLETGTNFPNGVVGQMMLTLDYSFTSIAQTPDAHQFDIRDFDMEPSGGASIKASYTLFGDLSGLAAGTHKVTAWFYLISVGTPNTNYFVDGKVKVIVRSK
jgi:hypothetical protein